MDSGFSYAILFSLSPFHPNLKRHLRIRRFVIVPNVHLIAFRPPSTTKYRYCVSSGISKDTAPSCAAEESLYARVPSVKYATKP